MNDARTTQRVLEVEKFEFKWGKVTTEALYLYTIVLSGILSHTMSMGLSMTCGLCVGTSVPSGQWWEQRKFPDINKVSPW